jgi:hypothetical protein
MLEYTQLPVNVPRKDVGQVIVKSIKNIQDMVDKRGKFRIDVSNVEQPDVKV